MSKDRHIVILGAGWVGAEAASRLARAGDHVVATNRSGTGPERERLQWESFDSTRHGSAHLAELLHGADAVVVCWAPSGRDVDRHRHYVGGAEALIEACELHPPGRLVYTSSTSALPSIDDVLDEDCEIWPDTERGRIQREAEETIRRGCDRLAIPWVILRLAGLYGPDRGLERLYKWEDGKALAGDGSAPTNLVHLDDVCRAIEAALALPADTSGIVHVCDDDHATRRQAFADQARRQGRPEPTWELPEAPPRGKRVSNRKLREILGVELRHPRRIER